MITYAALLKGINVGGHKKVPMQDLRKLVESLGHSEVATYIQSGNVIFRSKLTDEAKLVRELEERIEQKCGFTVPVALRSHAELAAVARAHPFEAVEPEPAKLHVAFLGLAPGKAAIARLDPPRWLPDEFIVRGRELYLHYANGAGKTRLTADFLERQLGTVATQRNWNTVQKLVELTASQA